MLACGNNLVGFILVEQGYGISTDNLAKSHLYCCQQVEFLCNLDIFYKLYQHLSIGIALKLNSLYYQVFLDGGIILNNAVVDDGKIL